MAGNMLGARSNGCGGFQDLIQDGADRRRRLPDRRPSDPIASGIHASSAKRQHTSNTRTHKVSVLGYVIDTLTYNSMNPSVELCPC